MGGGGGGSERGKVSYLISTVYTGGIPRCLLMQLHVFYTKMVFPYTFVFFVGLKVSSSAFGEGGVISEPTGDGGHTLYVCSPAEL